jgi:hypothetical protein
MQHLGDLALVRRVVEHGQAEGRLGDEDVALDGRERRACGVVAALVVAGDNGAAAAMLQHHLRAAEDMARRLQHDGDVAHGQPLAIGQRLGLAREVCAVAHAHDGQRLRRRRHLAVAGARMVAVAVGDDGAIHRPRGVDEEPAGLAIEPAGNGLQPVLGVQSH